MIGIFYYRAFVPIFLKIVFYKSRVTDFSMLQYNEIYSVILFEHIIFLPKDRFSLKDLTGYRDEKAQVSIIPRIFSFTYGGSSDNKDLIHPSTEPFLQYRHNKYHHHF